MEKREWFREEGKAVLKLLKHLCEGISRYVHLKFIEVTEGCEHNLVPCPLESFLHLFKEGLCKLRRGFTRGEVVEGVEHHVLCAELSRDPFCIFYEFLEDAFPVCLIPRLRMKKDDYGIL